MKKPKPASLCPILFGLLGSFAGFAFAGGHDAPHSSFPAVEIVQAIITAEENDPNADYPETGYIDWDPYLDPDTYRSWLYLEMPPEVLDKMELNQDQHGKPLFLSEPKPASPVTSKVSAK